MGTGCFLGFRFCQLHVEKGMSPTYTIQYELSDKEDFERYERDYAPGMRQKGLDRFGDKALAFRTTMEVLATGALRDQ